MRIIFLFLLLSQGLLAQADCVTPPAADDSQPPTLESRKKPDKGDPCQTADSNIARSMKNLLAAKPGPVVRASPWKGEEPLGLRDIARRFALNEKEKALLLRNGFVVPARLTMPAYGDAFHEIYQSELPLFVSADSILHAIYASNDAVIKRVEKRTIHPLLHTLLSELHCNLPGAGFPPQVTSDLDLYLTVARSLLEGSDVKSVTGVHREAHEILHQIDEASGMGQVQLFGRDRIIDFSQFQPRGHYEDMKGFFRSVMWLSRLEFNMVSRSSRSSHPGVTPDPTETPREALAAIALADLVGRARQMENLNKLDSLWKTLAGRREDLSPAQIAEIMKARGIRVDADAPAKLKSAIGPGFQRTMRMHYMPQGSTDLPVITTLLGPRITADSQAFMPLVNPEVPTRYLAGAMDAASILGSEHAIAYMEEDLAKFPSLNGQLAAARKTLAQNLGGEDLYSAWMKSILSLHAPQPAVVPAFMRSEAYRDFRLNSTVAAFGQIRHNYVLLAAQPYDEGGCVIPYGYVEPAQPLYSGLSRYAALGESAMKRIGAESDVTSYFSRTKNILDVLARIAGWENEGRELPVDAGRFLSMVTEMSPGGTGGPPTYTGWYFDLFFDRNDALREPSLVADFYTSVNLQKVSYAGVSETQMGIFVVDTGGKPRAVAGPVASAFMATGSTEKRLTDSDFTGAELLRPWTASYTVPAPPAQPVALDYPTGENAPMTLHVQAPLPLVVVELLDHHRRRLAVFEIKQPKARTEIRTPLTAGDKVGAIHLQAGDYHLWQGVSWMSVRAASPAFKDAD
jgi:hypothetical protein